MRRGILEGTVREGLEVLRVARRPIFSFQSDAGELDGYVKEVRVDDGGEAVGVGAIQCRTAFEGSLSVSGSCIDEERVEHLRRGRLVRLLTFTFGAALFRALFIDTVGRREIRHAEVLAFVRVVVPRTEIRIEAALTAAFTSTAEECRDLVRVSDFQQLRGAGVDFNLFEPQNLRFQTSKLEIYNVID